MTKATKILGGTGLAVIAAAAIIWRAGPTFTPPAGWWGANVTTLAPCPQTPPGPNPHLMWTNPSDAKQYYFRYDGTVRPQTPEVDGHFAGEGGSDHSLQYVLDGMEIPIRSGALGADGWPIVIYPAPYRDAPIEGHPETTICAKYVNGNGPRAKPCPSNQTVAAYSNSIKFAPQWTSGAAGRQAQINAQCNVPIQTVTPVPPFVTSTAVPTAPPVCPTCAAAATCVPTATKTRTPTRTKTPLCGATCTRTPTASSGIDPSVSRNLFNLTTAGLEP